MITYIGSIFIVDNCLLYHRYGYNTALGLYHKRRMYTRYLCAVNLEEGRQADVLCAVRSVIIFGKVQNKVEK